jgi:hypothetical protein
MSKRTLIIYALYKETLETDFFLDNGVKHDPNVDYVFVVNIDSYNKGKGDYRFLPSEKFNNAVESVKGKVMLRDNIGLDFGGYSCAVDRLIKSDLIDKYDYFFFINQTVIGPIFPVWYKNRTHWSNLFTCLINDRDKLVGPTINCFGDSNALGKSGAGFTGFYKTEELHVWSPHVQTWAFAMDKIGLRIAIDNGIFDYENPLKDKQKIIDRREIRLSSVILKSNYNIASMLNCSRGKDFRGVKSLGYARKIKFNQWGDVYAHGHLGEKVHPYETIFHKNNRQGGNGVLPDEYLTMILNA